MTVSINRVKVGVKVEIGGAAVLSHNNCQVSYIKNG